MFGLGILLLAACFVLDNRYGGVVPGLLALCSMAALGLAGAINATSGNGVCIDVVLVKPDAEQCENRRSGRLRLDLGLREDPQEFVAAFEKRTQRQR